MSVPRTVAEVLRRHVTLEVEGIDRMYLNVYQPRLQCEGQVAAFFRSHRGHTFASSALMDPMSKAFLFTLDREQTPKVIVLTWKECPWNGKKDFVRKAIYAVDGDRLKLCLSRKRRGEGSAHGILGQNR